VLGSTTAFIEQAVRISVSLLAYEVGHTWQGVLRLLWVAESKGQHNEYFKFKKNVNITLKNFKFLR
jgi:hypothetical protein